MDADKHFLNSRNHNTFQILSHRYHCSYTFYMFVSMRCHNFLDYTLKKSEYCTIVCFECHPKLSTHHKFATLNYEKLVSVIFKVLILN